jgi:hypothetical protein
VFADLHLEWPGHVVQVGTIEEGVRQAVDQAEGHLVSCRLQRRRSASKNEIESDCWFSQVVRGVM